MSFQKHKKVTPLIIIDMQTKFPNAKKIQGKVAHFIKKWPHQVILVSFVGGGKFLSGIKQRGKTNFLAEKKENDGSLEILKIIKDWTDAPRWSDQAFDFEDLTKLYVCGVNTRYCVAETAIGLAKFLNFCNTKIVVLKDLCADDDSRRHQDGLDKMLEYKNLQVKNSYDIRF